MTVRSISFVRGRVVAALVGAGLLLSACQGGGATPGNSAAASNTSASPSATPTTTPSAKYVPASAKGKAQNVPVPVKPALADQNSKAGLEAFTKYWFALLSYGYETGDLNSWSKLSSGTCTFCNNLKAGVRESFSAGGWQAGGTFKTPNVKATMSNSESRQAVDVQVLQEATSYYKKDGSKAAPTDPSGNSAVVVFAKYQKGAWFVDDMNPLR